MSKINDVWYAFYSQTGKEIVDICKEIGSKPALIATNNRKGTAHPGIQEMGVPILYGSHDHLMTYLRKQTLYNPADMLITLHGYMRIIPKDICEMYVNMYNGHPGLITEYPELKGKDPQTRTFANIEKYTKIGSVVHRVTSELDGGEVITSSSTSAISDIRTEAAMFEELRNRSLRAWKLFFVGEI